MISRILGVVGAAATVAALAAGCGSAANSTPPASPATPSAPATPAFSSAQGAAICNDLNAWLVTAWNEGSPRFNAELESDEQLAQGTQLGTDLTDLDGDLQSENMDALLSGPPGDPTDIQNVAQDCTGYGVTITEGGTSVRLP
jgi:hypothetical protein